MQRREFMQWIGCCVAGSYASQSIGTLQAQTASVHTRTPKRPNLLIVFPDQMRAHAMGFMKQDPVITPNLDRFAEQSLVLTQAVSNYPVCSPYRAMLMTGMYPHRNGVWSNCTSHSERYLPTHFEKPVLGQVVQQSCAQEFQDHHGTLRR